MEIINEGYLERALSENRRDWKKHFFVFQKNLSTGTKTLEYFKDNNWKKQEPRGVCNLYLNYTVTKCNDAKKNFVFVLNTVDKKYFLCAASEQLREKWLNTLQDSPIVTFKAVLVESPPSAYTYVKDFKGTLELKVGVSSVILLAPDSSSISWKFATIRRYKSQNGAFVLEVGRKAHTGQGVFRFEMSNPVELFDVLDKAVKDRIKSKGLQPVIEKQENAPCPARPHILQLGRGKAINNHFPSPQEDAEYSHIESFSSSKTNLADINGNSDYDQLFNGNRHIKRQTESFFSPADKERKIFYDSKKPSVFDSEQKLSSNTLFTKVDEAAEEETYEVMSGGTTVESKPRPQPPPRNNKPSLSHKPDALCNALNSARKMSAPCVVQDNEYDLLFEAKLNPMQLNSEYNHLNSTESDSIRNIKLQLPISPKKAPKPPVKPLLNQSSTDSEDFYDAPSTNITVLKSHKMPLKPLRSAPAIPKSPQKKSNRLIGGSLASKVVQPKFIQKKAPVLQPVYDNPKALACLKDDYYEVGSTILGEYKQLPHKLEDDDGYVEVPSLVGSVQDNIYQTP